MHSNYLDIIELAGDKEPLWYDENGCPRYAPFGPDLCPDIYSDAVALLKIMCQSCLQGFLVQMSSGVWGKGLRHAPSRWHYGDPPRHDCVGDTMNCDDLAVLEVWYREDHEWTRLSYMEGPIP